MSTPHRLVASVPMCHSSERVPGKNYRSFAGRPLYHHIVGTLLHGATAMNDVLLNSVAQIKADFYLQTHSTNPLPKPETGRRS